MTAEENPVLIRKGSAVITQDQFDARILRIPERDRLAFVRDGNKVDRLLNNLILIQQLAFDAREKKFDQGKPIQLQMQLAADKALADAWLERYVDSAPDADYLELAHEYYQLNSEKFVTEESLDLSHLLIKIDRRSEGEAIALISDIQAVLMRDPNQFDSLIREYSEDPSASSNLGHFLNVKRGTMVKEFEDAAFLLKEQGEISNIVNTEFGYHIIRLDHRHSSQPIRFEEIKTNLIAEQKGLHRERVRIDYLRKLTGVPVEIPEGAIESMLKRYFGENLENAPDYLGALRSDN
jgi:parvulin-like peptidyl-prolyl isomerase